MCHHKAPHRCWEPDEKHAHMYLNEDVPEPETLYDDYANRASAAEAAEMRMGLHHAPLDLKAEIPHDLPEMELRKWAYQRYIKDYLRVVASIDDNVGRLLDYLDDEGLAENTVVVYTSDQGFFLGDHGWYDKRFMYEESLRMPYIMRYPGAIGAGGVNEDMILNVDFGPTYLELAGMPTPDGHAGAQLRRAARGRDAGRLAREHVLSLLDAQDAPQCLRPLWHPHPPAQADLLLRRRHGHRRKHRRDLRARMGAV